MFTGEPLTHPVYLNDPHLYNPIDLLNKKLYEDNL